jgi:hypothetical protein
MSIHWGSLFAVFAVSLGSAVAVVGLVALGLLGLSARAPRLAACGAPAPRVLFSPAVGTALAAVALSTAAAIVLFGLWVMIVR